MKPAVARAELPGLPRAKAVKLEDELSRRGVRLRRVGIELIGPCPSCGGNDRFGINCKKQVWNCRQCAKGGDIIALVMHLDGRDFKSAVSLLAGQCSIGTQIARHSEPEVRESESDKAAIARFLWQCSSPAAGTLVETYLRYRGCWVLSPNIRFLRGRGEHPPAMISRMGPDGVHLTKLAPDGRGKAGTNKDKIMIGPSMGEPIIVQDNPERGELLIAEGVEDAASLALVTGWTAWAAASGGRIHGLMPKTKSFDKVFLAVDRDKTGAQALQRTQEIRSDVIPLQFAKILAIKQPLDANKALTQFGPDVLLAAIEWGEATTNHRLGRIGSHAMLDALSRANALFTSMVL